MAVSKRWLNTAFFRRGKDDPPPLCAAMLREAAATGTLDEALPATVMTGAYARPEKQRAQAEAMRAVLEELLTQPGGDAVVRAVAEEVLAVCMEQANQGGGRRWLKPKKRRWASSSMESSCLAWEAEYDYAWRAWSEALVLTPALHRLLHPYVLQPLVEHVAMTFTSGAYLNAACPLRELVALWVQGVPGGAEAAGAAAETMLRVDQRARLWLLWHILPSFARDVLLPHIAALSDAPRLHWSLLLLLLQQQDGPTGSGAAVLNKLAADEGMRQTLGAGLAAIEDARAAREEAVGILHVAFPERTLSRETRSRATAALDAYRAQAADWLLTVLRALVVRALQEQDVGIDAVVHTRLDTVPQLPPEDVQAAEAALAGDSPTALLEAAILLCSRLPGACHYHLREPLASPEAKEDVEAPRPMCFRLGARHAVALLDGAASMHPLCEEKLVAMRRAAYVARQESHWHAVHGDAEMPAFEAYSELRHRWDMQPPFKPSGGWPLLLHAGALHLDAPPHAASGAVAAASAAVDATTDGDGGATSQPLPKAESEAEAEATSGIATAEEAGASAVAPGQAGVKQ